MAEWWTQPMPSGWEAKWDAGQGRYFFINHSTKTTTWEDPRSKRNTPSPKPQPKPQPEPQPKPAQPSHASLAAVINAARDKKKQEKEILIGKMKIEFDDCPDDVINSVAESCADEEAFKTKLHELGYKTQLQRIREQLDKEQALMEQALKTTSYKPSASSSTNALPSSKQTTQKSKTDWKQTSQPDELMSDELMSKADTKQKVNARPSSNQGTAAAPKTSIHQAANANRPSAAIKKPQSSSNTRPSAARNKPQSSSNARPWNAALQLNPSTSRVTLLSKQQRAQTCGPMTTGMKTTVYVRPKGPNSTLVKGPQRDHRNTRYQRAMGPKCIPNGPSGSTYGAALRVTSL